MDGRGAIAAAALLLTAGLAGTPTPARASETELSGFVAADLRAFLRSPAQPGQSDAALNPSLVLQPELRHEWNDGGDRITAILFARFDSRDGRRTHFDLRELNWLHAGEGWDLRLGVDKVFWGVAESRHLVDIVNQTDLVEDIDGEDKLGQPMVNLGLQRDWGDLNLFVLPRFRERTFPGRKGRLRGPLAVATEREIFDSSDRHWHVDFAARYEVVIADWDIGLAQFHGTGREPRLVAATDGRGRPLLAPRYDIIDQTSLDAQVTLGDWLLKFEAIGRVGQGDPFAAIVGGFEYTFYGVLDSGADLGLLAEYLYDGRDGSAPATTFDDDIFLGLRLALNDAYDSDLLAGLVVDRLSGATFVSLEAGRRLSEHWSLEVVARGFFNAPAGDPGFGLRRDDYLEIVLTRYF
jgi:hypothetical protein